ncbi:hypothetical protein [Photobacterium damselae]|uniref:hypothetical protein n=1 Tax=Photobacterium damselae TaxID=38293 RepID=UPI0040694BDA
MTNLETYSKYIRDNVPNDPYEQSGKCLKYSTEMHKAFPELIIKRGYVSSPENLDNFAELGYDRQYPHVWLETEDGVIIDPTVNQFILLGKLDYTELDHPEKLKKCFCCGRYIDTDLPVCQSIKCIEFMNKEF